MCIEIGNRPQVVNNGELKLWKVVRKNDRIGIWFETCHNTNSEKRFQMGINVAIVYEPHTTQGEFHCFFIRKDARRYITHRYNMDRLNPYNNRLDVKIIRVYADSSDVVRIGKDFESGIPCLSVSKMEIKSLKHQR